MAYDLWGFAVKCPYYGSESTKAIICVCDSGDTISQCFDDKAHKVAHRKGYCETYSYRRCPICEIIEERNMERSGFNQRLKDCGFNRRSLAAALNMSESALSLKLSGERRLDLSDAIAIEDMTGISPRELFELIQRRKTHE